MPKTGWGRTVLRCTLAPLVCLTLASNPLAARTSKKPRPSASRAKAAASTTGGRVTDVRYWSLADATRVAVELSTEFKFRTEKLTNPDRLFFDIREVKPTRNPKGVEIIAINDTFVRQIRVAETLPGVTRIVLDLNMAVEHSVTQLANPDRLIIEVRLPAKPSQSPLAPTSSYRALDPAVSVPVAVKNQDADRVARSTAAASLPAPVPMSGLGAKVESVGGPATSRTPESTPSAVAAKRNSAGERSMTRVLGLKLARVVLDPGHGGHDGGTRGPSGLLEKDLVLDVSKRLGALIEERLGSEVVFTRQDDSFIALEERTRIANRRKADLFLSIHANSSTVRSASGVETYYLNFTTNKAALEVAARENASSERSIYDLRDLVQKIALKDKLDESREFAAKVQASLSTLSSHSNTKSKDRGVRKAPFVVLIGASMPSVLAEIGFVSNPMDEGMMKKAEYRQRLAEALFKGVSQYAAGLSRFQVAGQRRTSAGE